MHNYGRNPNSGKFPFVIMVSYLIEMLRLENVRQGDCDFCNHKAVSGRSSNTGDVFYMCEGHNDRLTSATPVTRTTSTVSLH